MTTTNDIELVDQPQTVPVSLIPTRTEMNVLMELANHIASSRMELPKGCSTPQGIFTKMLYGRELGISPMASLYEIDLIEGQGGMNARTQTAIVRRRGLGDIRLIETNRDRARVKAWRTDAPDEIFEFEFNRNDAQEAGLLDKKNYKRWPQAMMLARASSMAARALFPEIFLGVAYTPDELGADTDEDGRAVFLDTATTTGVKRKPVEPLTTEQAEQIVESPTVKPAATKPEGYCPPEDSTNQASRMKAQIKLLVANVLKLAPEHWNSIKARFKPDDRPMTPEELGRLRLHLVHLAHLAWIKKEMSIPDEKWQAALERRGAVADYQLSEADALALVEKLIGNIVPFKLEGFLLMLKQETGYEADNATPAERSTAGNG